MGRDARDGELAKTGELAKNTESRKACMGGGVKGP